MSLMDKMRRCLTFTGGRRRFFGAMFLFVAVIAVLTIWLINESKESPKVSFQLIKIGSYLHADSLVQATVDQDQIQQDIARQIFANAMTEMSGNQIDQRTRQELEKAQAVVSNALSKAIPAAMSSPQLKGVSLSAGAPIDIFLSGVLPSLLKISPSSWKQWQLAITEGNFSIGTCRVQSQRAACEINISGPDNKSAQVVSLWTRGDTLWRLERIIQIENLLQVMR